MEIILSPTAKRNLSRIGVKDIKKVDRKILELAEDPFIGKPLHGDFLGSRSLKAWPLRIVYEFDEVRKIINVINIDCRGRVYK